MSRDLPVWLREGPWWGLALWTLVGATGCGTPDARYGAPLERGGDALTVAESEAALSFSCPAMRADPRVGRMHEGDATAGLFSEYLVTVSGCGHKATYRISCREGGPCVVEE